LLLLFAAAIVLVVVVLASFCFLQPLCVRLSLQECMRTTIRYLFEQPKLHLPDFYGWITGEKTTSQFCQPKEHVGLFWT
jgi:hypothetical protein